MGTGCVVWPEEKGGVSSRVGASPWFVLCLFQVLGVTVVALAANSIISNFLAMARADLGRMGGGDAVLEGEPGGGETGGSGDKGGGGVTRCGGGACVFFAGLLVVLRFLLRFLCLSSDCWVGVSLATLGTTILMSNR